MADTPNMALAAQSAPSSPLRRAVTFRGVGFSPAPSRLHSWLAFAALIGVWQLVCSIGWANPIFLPSPLAIMKTLWQLSLSGNLWRDLSASLARIGIGWLLGTLLGLAFGVSMGLVSAFRAVGVPLVSALFPVPKIALLPLLILWMGIGEAPKITTIGAGVFFATAVATCSGVDAVPRNLIRMGQSFNMPMLAIVWKIVLPSALPSIIAGFRISISTALLLVVSAEMIGAQYGIGAFLLTAGNLMESDALLAGVVVLSVLGLTFGAVLSFVERTFLDWR